jgi:dienelactone hydrolase
VVPRRHSIDDASACVAAGRYCGPLLLMHGEDDHAVPVAHLDMIAQAARGARTGPGSLPVETVIVPGYGHRWLYEDAEVRRRTASFFARALGSPMAPDRAGELAAACAVERPQNPVYGFGAASTAVAAEAEAREKARQEARARAALEAPEEDARPQLN